MGAASTPARICPECGTRNSGLSLFCSECGESLTNAALADSGNQTTSAFRPVHGMPADDADMTQAIPIQPSMTGVPEAAHISTWESRQPVESRRGMVLGWIAGVLILLVIAWLGWTSFLDPGIRDDIIGLFS
jgi:uncharacterized membrane protein YvbJ